MPPPLKITATAETWPIAGEFTIARGAKREAHIVVAHISDGITSGRGECVPYGRYGETVESVVAAIHAQQAVTDRPTLMSNMPAGAARNALDCALWDYEAKQAGRSAALLAGLPAPQPLTTAYTISLADPATMAAKAARAAETMPLLKIKLGAPGDDDRMRQIRAACPRTRLIADANEAWTAATLPGHLQVAAETGFELIEQPLPEAEDSVLASIPHTVPICADESVHTRADLAALRNRYDAVNIKLDKAGGLTEALAMTREARTLGFQIMVGCMVATSLAIAPGVLLGQTADWVDLDGALLLARDRTPALLSDGALIYPPLPQLWG